MLISVWKDPCPPVLASTSPTRRQLLSAIGLEVIAVAPEVDERSVEAGLQSIGATPDKIALELARAKAEAVSGRYPDHWVIAADQTLACDGEQFHKPGGLGDAAAQLRRLSGRTHELHASVCCSRKGVVQYEHVETARMTMRSFSDEFLQDYLALAGPSVSMSVGGYQIEGLGMHLFEKIDGAHATILGLPLLPLLGFLRSAGALQA